MTDTPGWMPPTEPGAGAGGQAPAGGPPGSFGAPPGPPPGYGGFGGTPGYGTPGYGTPGYDQPGYGGYGGQPAYGGYGGQPGYGQPGAQWGAPPGWGRPAAPEPGLIPLRPLGLGEILDGGFAMIRQYPRVTLGLSAIVVGVTQLLSFLAQLPAALDRGSVDPDFFGGITVAQILAAVLSGLGVVILAGMLTSVMGEAVLGRGATIGETWRRVRPRFWALLGAGILGAVVPFVGLLFCLVPGAFLWGAWAFLTPVVVLERAGVIQSIRRSWRLAVPDFWRVWGIRALSVLIAWLVQTVVSGPLSLIAVGSVVASGQPEIGVVPLALITAGGIVAGTLTAPFSSGVLALLYIDRRMRAEGLDVTLQRVAQQAETA